MAHTPPGETRERVYRFVRERLLAGEPPTVREVQAAMGFAAIESARKQLDLLVREGRLVKLPRLARGYRLPSEPAGRRTISVPVLGAVAAGRLTEAIDHADGQVAFDAPRGGEYFALRVEGESMLGDGILPGDVVIVRRGPTAAPNTIVVAMVHGEATVKRLRMRRGRPVLEASNPAFAPILPAPDELTILGCVVEVRRRL
ncbi:MAG: transcriptional repressor LexA [Planctomycetota bacterium]